MVPVSINSIKAQDIPSVSSRIAEMHREYFCRQLGWHHEFEAEVKKYIEQLHSTFQPSRETLWVATGKDGSVAGSIAIDGREKELDSARLRVFIVDHGHQYQGIGSMLLSTAVQHCRNTGYKRIVLWTFDSLTEAIRLYIKYGFRLAEERAVSYWGRRLTEQRFILEFTH